METGELNQVVNGPLHVTADSDDDDSIGYLMQGWESSCRSGAVLTVIVPVAETRGAVDIAVDGDAV